MRRIAVDQSLRAIDRVGRNARLVGPLRQFVVVDADHVLSKPVPQVVPRVLPNRPLRRPDRFDEARETPILSDDEVSTAPIMTAGCLAATWGTSSAPLVVSAAVLGDKCERQYAACEEQGAAGEEDCDRAACAERSDGDRDGSR